MNQLWVDANVILRFITGDPEALAERARRLMGRVEQGQVVLQLSLLALAEVIWVLKSFYRYPMAEIAPVVISLVSAPGIEVKDEELIIRAVELARDRNVSFADAFLALKASEQGEKVVTFDEHDFRRLPVEWVVPD